MLMYTTPSPIHCTAPPLGITVEEVDGSRYRKVPKFSDTRKLCCNQPKIQTKKPSLRVFRQKDAIGIANNVDPDQTAP